jgi:hypothetical protein
MVVKMVVKPIAKLSEEARRIRGQLPSDPIRDEIRRRVEQLIDELVALARITRLRDAARPRCATESARSVVGNGHHRGCLTQCLGGTAPWPTM